MNLFEILNIKYPQANFDYPSGDIQLCNHNDGNGDFIKYWNESALGSQPTQQEINIWYNETSVNIKLLQNKVEIELRKLIESKPNEKGYDNIATLCSYVTSSNNQWKAEADSFIQWRDLVFQQAYTTLYQVEQGQLSMPTVEDFINNLPVLTWP